MNAQPVDYSLILGVVSAVIGLCVILTVWYGAKTCGSRIAKRNFNDSGENSDEAMSRWWQRYRQFCRV